MIAAFAGQLENNVPDPCPKLTQIASIFVAIQNNRVDPNGHVCGTSTVARRQIVPRRHIPWRIVVQGRCWTSSETKQPATTALLNSLWGREKNKFEHLRQTKDLAATSTKPK